MKIRQDLELVLPDGEIVKLSELVKLYKELQTRKRAEGESKQLYELRKKRQKECFSVVDRGRLWYNDLTNEQLLELSSWRRAWLDVTKTLVVPNAPEWINKKLEGETIL